jgi:cytochrome c-type biogenesis protein CcmH/NrfG
MELDQPVGAEDALRKALAARPPYPPARYYLSQLALLKGDTGEAGRELDALVRERPRHGEARLLRATIMPPKSKDRLAAAQALVKEDPADPRAQYVLWQAALGTGELEAAAGARRALESLLEEEGAARRLAEFQAATRGPYLAPNRRKTVGGWRQYR